METFIVYIYPGYNTAVHAGVKAEVANSWVALWIGKYNC